jgi:hypothetical protein
MPSSSIGIPSGKLATPNASVFVMPAGLLEALPYSPEKCGWLPCGVARIDEQTRLKNNNRRCGR